MSLPEKSSPLLRQLPSVDELVAELRVKGNNGASDRRLAEVARQAIDQRRRRLQEGEAPAAEGGTLRDALKEVLVRDAEAFLEGGKRPALRPLINATGVVLHTNLGRAPLSENARNALHEVSRGYCNLEYELGEGRRGKRGVEAEKVLRRLTGAESALVVNNNAAAVMFAIRALAEGKEVVISRGELIEIGGSFRIPEIMLQSGARLVEVGTTNKTRLEDYERAIGPETALLLKVHPSNYRIVGFTREAPRESLVALGRARGIPVMEDLGSGCFLDLPGLPAEPTVGEVVRAEVDIVTFSGDKLLGGPQAGIVVGKSRYLENMKKHPLMRILRTDKLTLSALEATLLQYLDPERAMAEIPALRMLSESPEEVGGRVEALLRVLDPETVRRLGAAAAEASGTVGGGAMPLAELPSRALALAPAGVSPNRVEALLRKGTPPVVSRICEDRVLLDLRCVSSEEINPLAGALKELASRISPA